MNPTPTSVYDTAVKNPLGKKLAKSLGLPNPPHLQRRDERPETLLNPVLVLGEGDGADALAEELLAWGGDIRRRHEECQKIGSIVLALDALAAPAELSAPVLAAAGALKKLAPHGRIVVVSRMPSAGETTPATLEQVAARGAVEGLVRSLGHEMRAGATANGVRVAGGVRLTSPSVLHALRFFLSARSAFVTGQLLDVAAEGPAERERERALDGLTLCVTGASRGIGAAIARTLATDGATVIAVDVMAQGVDLSRLCTEIGAVPVLADVTTHKAGDAIAQAARQAGGTLDGIVHNAGITRDKMFANMTVDRWDAVMAVNLEAQITLTAALRESGVLSKQYRHVGIASTSGIAGNRGQTNYAASKSGVIAYVAALARDLAESGGTANAIAPGFIETDMTAKIPPLRREFARRLNSLGQGGLPVDVAEGVAFLLAPEAGGIQGETLRVCGQNMVGK